VLRAFGAAGRPLPLGGGQGTSWHVGDLVLKPADLAEEQLAWQAAVLTSVRPNGFRVAPPVTADHGGFLVDGWSAWQYVEGVPPSARWPEIIAVGERFHAAVAHIPRPEFLDRRDDPWAIGDRVAWDELPAESYANVKHVARLASLRRPLDEPMQLVHGDLTGNVLFSERVAPAIIDLSPYWRPPAFASAVVVADALSWEGADERILASVSHVPCFEQFFIRALLYRVVTDRLFRLDEPIGRDDDDPYLAPVELAARLAVP
jgi:uncharacterized protein (TIGR02569 family)